VNELPEFDHCSGFSTLHDPEKRTSRQASDFEKKGEDLEKERRVLLEKTYFFVRPEGTMKVAVAYSSLCRKKCQSAKVAGNEGKRSKRKRKRRVKEVLSVKKESSPKCYMSRDEPLLFLPRWSLKKEGCEMESKGDSTNRGIVHFDRRRGTL